MSAHAELPNTSGFAGYSFAIPRVAQDDKLRESAVQREIPQWWLEDDRLYHEPWANQCSGQTSSGRSPSIRITRCRRIIPRERS
jgi:hypothetical protein